MNFTETTTYRQINLEKVQQRELRRQIIRMISKSALGKKHYFRHENSTIIYLVFDNEAQAEELLPKFVNYVAKVLEP